AAMAQQGIEARVATTERAERLDGWAAAADGEDLGQEAPSRLRDRLLGLVCARGFLEGRIGVGRQDFRPLVAVVAGRIPASEDVREAVLEPVPGRGLEDGDFLADRVEQ